jgi:hypothetical protein
MILVGSATNAEAQHRIFVGVYSLEEDLPDIVVLREAGRQHAPDTVRIQLQRTTYKQPINPETLA